MVRKDVLRTDRQHKFYSGETNENITALYNILTTYALHYPSVGYCQGMSDLLSPILMIMQVNVYTTCFTRQMIFRCSTYVSSISQVYYKEKFGKERDCEMILNFPLFFIS